MKRIKKFPKGGKITKSEREAIIVDSQNDPRYKAYNDSLNLYNKGLQDANTVARKDFMRDVRPDELVPFNSDYTLNDWKKERDNILNNPYKYPDPSYQSLYKLLALQKKLKINPIGYYPVGETTTAGFKKPVQPVKVGKPAYYGTTMKNGIPQPVESTIQPMQVQDTVVQGGLKPVQQVEEKPTKYVPQETAAMVGNIPITGMTKPGKPVLPAYLQAPDISKEKIEEYYRTHDAYGKPIPTGNINTYTSQQVPQQALGGMFEMPFLHQIQRYPGGGWFGDLAHDAKNLTWNKAGQTLGNTGRLLGDTALSAVGLSNIIQDEDYKGAAGVDIAKASHVASPIAQMALPIAANIIAPGTGQFVKIGQKAIGQFNPQQEYKMGGIINSNNPTAEVEKKEVFQTPDGLVRQVNGPSHENGGVQVNIPNGTRIWSDRLKKGNKTFAKYAEKYKTDKEEEILNDNMSTNIAKKNAKMNLDLKNRALDNLFSEQESMKQDIEQKDIKRLGGYVQYKHGGIYIKPSKRGTFTNAAKKHGQSVQGFASKVLAHKENYSSAMVKKAVFAKNAAKWKHPDGGTQDSIQAQPLKNVSTNGTPMVQMQKDGKLLYNPDGTPMMRIDFSYNTQGNPIVPKMPEGGTLQSGTPYSLNPAYKASNLFDTSGLQLFYGPNGLVPLNQIQPRQMGPRYSGISEYNPKTNVRSSKFPEGGELNLNNISPEDEMNQYYNNLPQGLPYSPETMQVMNYAVNSPGLLPNSIDPNSAPYMDNSNQVFTNEDPSVVGQRDTSKLQNWYNNNKQALGTIGQEAGIAALNNMGNLAYLIDQGKRYDKVDYGQVTPDYVTDEASKRAIREGYATGQYNLRNSGQMRQSGQIGLANQRMKQLAESRERISNINSQIGNQFKQYNKGLEMQSMQDEAQNKGAALSNYYTALGATGQNLSAQRTDYLQKQMDQKKLNLIKTYFPDYTFNEKTFQYMYNRALQASK